MKQAIFYILLILGTCCIAAAVFSACIDDYMKGSFWLLFAMLLDRLMNGADQWEDDY